MPLNLSGLQSDIETFSASPPPDIAGCAAAWANAMRGFAAAVVPVSLTVDAAADTLEGALANAFATPAAAPSMEIAFAAFATTVAGGMAPAFVGTPPPDPVNFAAQFASALAIPPPGISHAAAAAQTSAIIDTWMKKGTATPAVGGAPVNWT